MDNCDFYLNFPDARIMMLSLSKTVDIKLISNYNLKNKIRKTKRFILS